MHVVVVEIEAISFLLSSDTAAVLKAFLFEHETRKDIAPLSSMKAVNTLKTQVKERWKICFCHLRTTSACTREIPKFGLWKIEFDFRHFTQIAKTIKGWFRYQSMRN
ncbi:hypothetical protein P5673_006965 [Acropora cervicornis]|uniref:Uncharacterized protein n=1 Tax=Acropora cervicornis TaxID=6130 RepID=A0AAD9QWX1_ACRCE|nr:hypothetical protein P5673_006965 [Acropora cervicornis]